MPQALPILGLVVGAAGTYLQYAGQKKAAAASARAERLREQQSNLEIVRARRQRIREAIVARANSLSNLSDQGAVGSSAQAGAFSQITSNLGRNISGLAQNKFISGGIFAANRAYAAGQATASFGSGLASFGGSLRSLSSSPFFGGTGQQQQGATGNPINLLQR